MNVDLLLMDNEKFEAPVFRREGSVRTLGFEDDFVAVKNFIQGSHNHLIIYKISSCFNSWFLSCGGKVEKSQRAREISYSDLARNSLDYAVIKYMGGENKVVVTLSNLFQILMEQGEGRRGPLLVNGYQNIFYIKDFHETVRTVIVSWSEKGWILDASLIYVPIQRRAGSRFFV